MQAVQVDAPASRRVSRPAGHNVHTLAANMEGRNVRLGQGTHWVLPLMPALPKLPSALAARAAPVADTWPAAHSEQVRAPGSAANVPGPQARHETLLGVGAYVPGLHGLHDEAPEGAPVK